MNEYNKYTTTGIKLTRLLSGYFPLVVCIVLPSKEEVELRIVSLFLHGHLLKLWAISSHKIGQFVNDVTHLWLF